MWKWKQAYLACEIDEHDHNQQAVQRWHAIGADFCVERRDCAVHVGAWVGSVEVPAVIAFVLDFWFAVKAPSKVSNKTLR